MTKLGKLLPPSIIGETYDQAPCYKFKAVTRVLHCTYEHQLALHYAGDILYITAAIMSSVKARVSKYSSWRRITIQSMQSTSV